MTNVEIFKELDKGIERFYICLYTEQWSFAIEIQYYEYRVLLSKGVKDISREKMPR